MAGEVPLGVVGAIGISQHVQTSALKPIVFATAQRTKAMPDVPTLAESGFPDLVVSSWNGLLAPAQTPKPIIERLARELNSALANPAVRDKITNYGSPVDTTSPETFGAEIKAEFARYGQAAKAAGLKAT